MSETETYLCGSCGDRVVVGAVHECWVLYKVWTQEKLTAPGEEAAEDVA